MPTPPRNDLDSICVSCGTPNGPDRHFCLACDAPLTSHAVNDPFATIFAEGWVYRRAQNAPRSMIVVVGIWMLWLPTLLGSILGLVLFTYFLIAGDHRGGHFELTIPFLSVGPVLAVVAWISITILRRTTKEYLRVLHARGTGDEEHDDEEEDEPHRTTGARES